MNSLRLKPGKEKPILARHHWIFSGAIAQLPPFENGEILAVESSQGAHLGFAYVNKKSSITGRMIAFGDTSPEEAIETSVKKAIAFRKTLFNDSTTGYRLINGEGDMLPGLVVDWYQGVIVLQIATLGMERMKPKLVKLLKELLNPVAIYEKSKLPSRKEEGLTEHQELVLGKIPEPLTILENGLTFRVDPIGGQKTGFFLDQREMRAYIKTISAKKKVLNCFAYTGGFSIYALAGGAEKVDSVDISKEAMAMASENVSLNGFDLKKCRFFAEDVFSFLREKPLDYGVVILDPPAFAKRAGEVVQACRGYKDINRIALQKMPKGSLLITSSCSHFVDEKLFQQVLFQAALEASRNVRLIGRHRMAEDHPVNLFHPEGEYLKSLILYVE